MVATIRAFNELTPEDEPLAGAKAAVLARLFQRGYPVPDGLVLLPAAFAGDGLSAPAWAELQARLARLRDADQEGAFAIRSSALGEDSARASFAGEFETVLDVSADEAIPAAIEAVRRSRRSERVQAYSQAQGLDAEHEMAVIVQQLVRAEMAGVLFTADPITGGRDHMVGNLLHGPGESLVAGEAQPHEFTLERPRGRYQGPPELEPFARRLYRLAKRVEKELGCPQDLEWAIAGNRIHLLQSRPITTLSGFDPATGEFNDSLTGDYTWSCVNVGEAVSVVMTPFTWSLLRGAYSQLDIVAGHSSLGNIGGRPYQNVTVMASAFRALGRNWADLSTELGGVRAEYLETMDQYLTPLPEATLFSVLPGAIRMIIKQRRGARNLAEFLRGNPRWCDTVCQRIRAVETAGELAALMEGEVMPTVLESFWSVIAATLRHGELVAKARRRLVKMVDADDADVLLANVSSRDQPLVSMGPLVGLARVARGEMTKEAYLEQWGHRGPEETEAYVPRPFENPDWLDRQLETFAQSPVDVEGLLATQRARFEAAWQRLQDRFSHEAGPMRRRLAQAAAAARAREATRSELTRQMWVFRVWGLQAGDVTGLGDGAFFLTIDELLDLLAGKGAPTGTIHRRRQTYERYKALPPYPLLIRGRFDPLQWASDPERQNDVYDSHGLLTTLKLETPEENVLLGMPGSAGQVTGVVRRLDHPEDGDQLKDGEILVTKQTNIGWTLFFARAGAIVTEVGAPLSHAAVVARELGIPAVVNCGNVTTRLSTGDRVRVDGTRGRVEILAD